MPVQPIFEHKDSIFGGIKGLILIMSSFIGLMGGTCRDVLTPYKLTPMQMLRGGLIGLLLGFSVGFLIILIIGLFEKRNEKY